VASLIALVGFEAAALLVLRRAGQVEAWRVDWQHFGRWLDATPIEDVVAGLARWAGLVIVGWLCLTTSLYLLATVCRAPRLMRAAGVFTLPGVRRVVEGTVAVSIMATAFASRVGPALAQEPAGGWAKHPTTTAAALRSPPAFTAATRLELPPDVAHAVEPTATEAGRWVVAPGDNFWDIAAADVAHQSGVPVETLRAADIVDRWREIIEASESAGGVPSGDPNLIYAGAVQILPPTRAVAPAPSAAVPTNPPAVAAPAPAGASTPAPAVSAPPQPALTTPAPAPPATPAAPVTDAPHATVASPSAPATSASIPATTTVPTTTAAASGARVSPATAVTASTSPAAESTPQVQKRAKAASDRVPLGPAAVGVSSLLGGIFVWRMRREGMAAQRRRRRGRELVQQPDPVAEPVERRVRAIAEVETVHWVDATLRYASAALAEAGGEGVEGILCVRPGQLGMELVVDPAAPPVGRFDSADDGRTWTLDPDLGLAELQDLAWGQILVPALCSVGSTPDGPVLVDLEQAGVLAVEGDAARVEGFLAGAALEMASAPWAADTTVYLLGGDERLAGRDLVESIDDVARFVADLDQLTSLVADEDLGAAPSTLAARVAPGNAEGWFPAVVVAHPGADSEAVSQLAARARPRRSGLALIGPGPLPGATWRLVLGPDGGAVLEPLGLELDSRIDADVVAALTGRIATRADQADLAPVIDLVPEPMADVSSSALGGGGEEEPMEGEVRFLGPVEVTWAAHVGPAGPDRAALLAAAAAFLGAHSDHPVPGPRLQEALWPLGLDDSDVRAGSVKDGTLRSTMSRLRTALGKDSLGRSHLPAAKHGTYAFGPRFGCDWCRFQKLAAAAHTASSAEAIELLRRALGLIRGRPFEDAPPIYFGWADDSPLVSDIEQAVAIAAEELGERALQAGDPELAEWAARQGLRVVPVREDLHRVRFQAAFDAGDPDGLDAAHTEAVRAVRTHIDPTEPLQDETERLYQRLKRACRSRDAQGEAAETRRERTTTG
jgi:hypothetical protein